MGKVIVVTSGKGGVGKTTSTAALGAALARGGQRVVVVDFDVGLRNLDLVMGAERRVVFDLTNVVLGTAKLSEALLKDERLDALYLLPASRTRGKEALTEDGVARVICELRDQFDWVVCDSPAGIERGAMLAMRFADEAIIVVNPEISSVRDSSRILGLVDTRPLKVETGGRLDKHLLITRFDPVRVARREMLSVDDVREVLPVPLLGIIPESEEVLRASNLGAPITVCGRESAVSRAYIDAARRIKGDRIEMTVPVKDKSRFTRWLGGRAA
jgi:septum site-determining protein MinD